MKKLLYILTILCQTSLLAQTNYPQDYFIDPLDINLVLAGTFAELRANHFHSGLDIKTQQREGLKVYACADGFVSRIKISHGGYGKALYITHPNGYTTVYAHLQKFAPKIEAYIKEHQYGQESYEIEVFPGAVELLVKQGDVVAYSGNSGGSEGPHLHFEIRDNEERPINPMLFGIDIKDTTKPIIKEVYAYPISDDAHINQTNEMCKLRLIPQQNGDYTVENITAFGTIGFGIVSTDRQDLAANNNGLYDIESFFNGQPNFEIEFSRFSFAETSHLNRYIDYGVYKTKKQRIQKLFVEKNNPLSLYRNLDNNGFLRIEDSTTSVYKIRVKDYKNNDCWLTLNIKGMKAADIKKKETPKSNYYIYADQTTTLSKDNVTVTIYPNTFYDDFPTDFEVKSDTVFINEDVYPMQKSMSIAYDVSQYDEQDKKQLYVAELVGYYKKPYYTSTKHEGNKIIGLTKYLGTYALVKDSVPPSITPNNFDDGKWLSKYRYLQLKVDDKESGISSYRATVNGKWILMEYDYKKKMLTYDFNDGRTSTENKLKVIVTDNVGNSTTFEATFFRK
ncbi:MAG: M23 family metallopeptidase [Mangrovimonas sp.]|nr:M23 family metallopeptidase [Mangrovimonas sp.]HPF96709.1 M23 family metallopeptidase [Mangrovimonas sp.]